MNALAEQFVIEARELIQQASDDLMAVEREASVERIDRIFRAFHTLKGSAGVVALPAMILTLHAAEDLLSAIQSGRLAITPAIVDQALACLDQVSQWVDVFELHSTLPLQAGQDAKAMAERLQNLLPGSGAQASAKADREDFDQAGSPTLSPWVTRLIRADGAARHVRERSGDLLAVSYEPRAGCFFDGDDPVALMRTIPDLLAFHIEAREPWPPLTELDPYTCNLRLQALSAGSRADLSDIFRLVPDQVQIVDIPLEALAAASRADKGGDADNLVRGILEEQRRMIAASSGKEDARGRIGAAARVAGNALRHAQRADLTKPIDAAMEDTDATALLAALDQALALLAANAKTEDWVDEISLRPSEPGSEGAGHAASRLLRVDEARIDALFNLAGELSVAKNAFAHLTRRIENELGGAELTRAVKREYEVIERLSGEMHAAILQLRMVPVAQVFRSFPRLVRDMAQRLDKKIALVTRGETTESDKTIVDHLFEPLLHLVRNALDHGIERPDERRDAGKPEVATVTLEASRRGDRFVIEVSDDGRGIDPTVVRNKAREQNILAADELATLSDEQALDLIFSAGFSTAAMVSDISGRGVGMDIVRATIEQIGGRVSLTSRIGIGTTVHLDLPLTIAMSQIMVVEAGGQTFGIAMDAVTETVRLTPDRISQIKGNEGFVLRDRVVPICALAELMKLSRPVRESTNERLLVVVEAGGRIVAIEVEAIRDRLEVVLKPLQGLLANARGYAGTTLLSDGAVLLVLDIREIMP